MNYRLAVSARQQEAQNSTRAADTTRYTQLKTAIVLGLYLGNGPLAVRDVVEDTEVNIPFVLMISETQNQGD